MLAFSYVYSSIMHDSQLWKQCECLLTRGWINMWFIYAMEYYSAIKKNEILPFATIWTKLECILLSEISQSEKDEYHGISLICEI